MHKSFDPFDNLRSLIHSDLDLVNELIISSAKSKVHFIPQISNYLTSAGGKRLRPMLTIACAKAFGIKGVAHVKLATAVEYIHTATLLHDDVIDESKMRRGKKVANLLWGNKPCILVGDYLLSQAFVLMVEAGNMQALDLLAKTACLMTESELWQLDLLNKTDITIEEYIELIRGKTAYLFAAACSSGAILAGQSKEEVDALYNYGLNLGICFQIVDDILDYSAPDDSFGKNIGNDLKEGKVTLPMIFALKDCNPKEHKILLDCFTSSQADLTRLYEIFTSTDAIKKAKEQAEYYAEKAITYLKTLDENEYLQALYAVTEYIPKRVN